MAAGVARQRRTFDTWGSYQMLFEDHLEAVNKAPRTITTYRLAVVQLGQFLAERGMPRDPTVVTREHLIEWMRHLQRPVEEGGQGVVAATARQRYRSISAFFKFLVETEEISENPMRKMKPPHVPEQPVPLIGDEEIRRLFKLCSGTAFDDRRDKAILSLLLDTGMRLSEVANLTLDDLDMDEREVSVLGKGRRRRVIRFVRETRTDLQRYLLARSRHPHEELDWLWLGKRGHLSDTGVYQMLKRRCEDAGIAHINPHKFRHQFAHQYLLNGGQEGDLMRVTGWRSRSMVDRYGSSAASERSREAHDRFSPRKGF